MKRLSLIFVGILLIATACGPFMQRKFVTTTPFDKEQAFELLKPGSNTIVVNAFMRQRGGGVVPCSGYEVMLTPVTDYATERMAFIFGKTTSNPANGAFLTAEDAARIDFETGRDPNYDALKKSANCNFEAKATFNNVADGEFYATVSITWDLAESYSLVRNYTGGLLMKRIKVQGGETVEAVMSNVSAR